MARSNKKIEAVQQVSKIESGLLTGAIAIATVLLVGFIVWLIVFLVNKASDDIVDPYENYITITTSEFNTIINSNKPDSSSRYQDLATSNTKLYDLLLMGREKPIYILFYSSDDSLYFKENPKDTNKKLEEIITKISPEGKDDIIILLFDSTSSTNIYNTLKNDTALNLSPIGLNQDCSGPYLLKIEEADLIGNDTGLVRYTGTPGIGKYFADLLDLLKEISNG
jgi:hypothetical protein